MDFQRVQGEEQGAIQGVLGEKLLYGVFSVRRGAYKVSWVMRNYKMSYMRGRWVLGVHAGVYRV